MLKLHMIQAEYGDCFVLEFSSENSKPKHILIDGGPPHTYEKHLRAELQAINGAGGRLDLTVLSHVDSDHIIGLLDMVSELRLQRADRIAETISVNGLWHNSFSETIGAGNDIETRLRTFLASAGNVAQAMTLMGMVVESIGEGSQLRQSAELLGIPINQGFPHNLISADDAPRPLIFDNLSLRVIGPTSKNLDELRKDWKAWLEKAEGSRMTGDHVLAVEADTTVPNLSSIMLLAEADGIRILLTGDGRWDHLTQGLEQANLLDSKACMHVDVLKLPHHGSSRNVSRDFFKKITADKYVISANGKNGNPDSDTLKWMVEAAKEQERAIEIWITNSTCSTRKLQRDYDPKEYGYHLVEMEKASNSVTLPLS